MEITLTGAETSAILGCIGSDKRGNHLYKLSDRLILGDNSDNSWLGASLVAYRQRVLDAYCTQL